MTARTYRSPRYMVDNLAAISDVSVLTGTNDPNRSINTRTIDGLNGRAGAIINTTNLPVAIGIDRLAHPASQNRQHIDRIVMSGSNLSQAFSTARVFGGDTFPPTDPINCFSDRDADPIAVYSFTSHNVDGVTTFTLIDDALALGDPEFQYLQIVFSGTTLAAFILSEYTIGEIFAGPLLDTNSGIVNVWSDTIESATNLVETDARNVYSKQRGDERRVWGVTYQGINDEDAQTLDYMRRQAGVELNAFWFENPSQGVDTTTVQTISTAGWSGADATLTFDPLGSSEVMTITATAATPRATLNIAETSMRGKVLSFDIQVQPSNDRMLNEDSFYISLRKFSITGEDRRYSISKYVISGGYSNGNLFQRVSIDLDADPVNASTTDSLTDLDRIDTIVLFGNGMIAADSFLIKNFRIEDSHEYPAFVELVSYNKQQSSQNPGFKLLWDIDLTLRERTS